MVWGISWLDSLLVVGSRKFCVLTVPDSGAVSSGAVSSGAVSSGTLNSGPAVLLLVDRLSARKSLPHCPQKLASAWMLALQLGQLARLGKGV